LFPGGDTELKVKMTPGEVAERILGEIITRDPGDMTLILVPLTETATPTHAVVREEEEAAVTRGSVALALETRPTGNQRMIRKVILTLSLSLSRAFDSCSWFRT
jgi:hypothetical protein